LRPAAHLLVPILALSTLGGLTACSDDDDGAVDTADTTGASAVGALDPATFVDGALVSDITTVECTLSGGTETTCYSIEIAGVPADSAVGPFCPETITSTADESGIWFDGDGRTYDADGDFILNLPNLYGDAVWQLHDIATGEVNITDTQEGCEAAARPDVDAAYRNFCVECSLDYVDGGVSQTVLIPVEPVPLDAPGALTGNVGISLNGTVLAAPAPVQDILSNFTIAPFDDCGGHVNPNVGYHYHAATGCTEVGTRDDGHAALMAWSLDGYGIYGMLDEDGNEHDALDECRGVTDEVRGYHYHAASSGENMFIGCFRGEAGSSGGEDGGGGPGEVPGGPPPGGRTPAGG